MQALHRIDGLLLTSDRVQRLRLSQSALAWVLMGLGVLTMQYAAWSGKVMSWLVVCWASFTLGGLALAFVWIRKGWSRRWRDPALTVPQLGFAIGCAAVAYAMAGPMRGSVLPTLMVVLLFGMYNLKPRGILLLCVYSLVTFGAVMHTMSRYNPRVFAPEVEVAHFAILLAMVPALVFFGVQLGHARTRLAEHRTALLTATEGLRRLAVRDESTGLFNQRHMRAMLGHELKRRARCGPAFSVVRMDLGSPTDVHDEPQLTRVAALVEGLVRRSDVLSRWSERSLMLLLPQTEPSDVQRLLERLRRGLRLLGTSLSHGAQPPAGVAVGVTTAQVDDSLSDLIDRLEQAVFKAGRGAEFSVAYNEAR